jgi:hypothetical protein
VIGVREMTGGAMLIQHANLRQSRLIAVAASYPLSARRLARRSVAVPAAGGAVPSAMIQLRVSKSFGQNKVLRCRLIGRPR